MLDRRLELLSGRAVARPVRHPGQEDDDEFGKAVDVGGRRELRRGDAARDAGADGGAGMLEVLADDTARTVKQALSADPSVLYPQFATTAIS